MSHSRRPVPPAPRPDWAFFLDVDGTLAELAETPTRARVAPALRAEVAALHQCTGGAVAIVSGRGLAEIDRLFGRLKLPAAGHHGAERRDARGAISRRAAPALALALARTALAPVVARHPGLLLEDKGVALALHYRGVPRLGGMAHAVMRAQQRALGEAFAVQSGKRVVELLPAGCDKGGAVRAFMREAPFRGRTPVCLGDDVTDEHAFAVVNALGGYAVKVGPGATVARWHLDDVDAVHAWIADATCPRKRSPRSSS